MDIDIKTYLDEQFEQLRKQLGYVIRDAKETREYHDERIRDLEVEIKVIDRTRPSVAQLLAACATTLTLGIGIGTLIFRLFG